MGPRLLSAVDEAALRARVQAEVGSCAVPAKFVVTEELPETHSGKYVRALLRCTRGLGWRRPLGAGTARGRCRCRGSVGDG